MLINVSLLSPSSTCCTVLDIRAEHRFVGVCDFTSLLQKIQYEWTKQLGKRGRKAMKYQQMALTGDSSVGKNRR